MTAFDQDRQKCLKILALADAGQLAKYLQCLKIPSHKVLRQAETGLVMVRGRIGNTGNVFNLGELLVTRYSVAINGVAGHAYVAGNDAVQAQNIAICDALYQQPAYRTQIAEIVKKLDAHRKRAQKRAEKEIAATKVNFFTMVRGED